MDRDYVIRRLERACQLVWNGGHCNIVDDKDALDVAYAIHDAIALLQNQKAVKPEWRQGKAYCGNCGCEIDRDAYRGKRSQIFTIATSEGVFTITPEGITSEGEDEE